MLMMLPPPERRSSGTANLHIRKAPVRFTAIALFHCSRLSVSTVPSGVAVAATFTSVVSLPNASIVRATASLALASSATSASKPRARPPASTIERATLCALSGSRSAIAISAPSRPNKRAIAPPISPPPPVMSATRPANLPSLAILMHRLHETAVDDCRLRRERRLDGADLGEAFRHFGVNGVRHIAVATEQLQLGDQIVVGFLRVLRLPVRALHQDIDRLLFMGRIVQPGDAPLVVAREGDERVAMRCRPRHVGAPYREGDSLRVRLGVAQIGQARGDGFEIGRRVEDRRIDSAGGQCGETVARSLGIDEIDVADLQPRGSEKRLDVNERDVVRAADADQLTLQLSDRLDV